MSLYVIGDRDTVLALRLVGAEGRVAASAAEARESLDRALQRDDLKLLLITREWAVRFQDHIDHLKMTRLQPVVMEIPGGDTRHPEQPISKLVSRAIGISL